MAPASLHCNLPLLEVHLWAAKDPDVDDAEAVDAAAKILRGDFSAATLERIIRWKSHRRLDLIYKNSPEEIADAWRLAIDVRQPRSAFSVLMGLRGVETPMASAILTAIDQNKYTVIDIRVLAQPHSGVNAKYTTSPETYADLRFEVEDPRDTTMHW